MVLQSFTSFFILLFHPAVKRKERKREEKKNHSRQNANEPGSYYDANEIPP